MLAKKVNIMENYGKGLVSKMLGLTKKEVTIIEGIVEEYSLEKLVEGVCNDVNPKAGEKMVPIIVDIDENIPTLLKGEANILRYVLKNLILDALKNIDVGYIKLLAEGHNNNSKIKLLFKLKYTGKVTNDIIKGDVSSTLENIGSKILVNSDNNQFSEVSFELEQDVIKEKKVVNKKLNNIEMLVIDDNEININIIKGLLKDYDVKIHSGNSGRKCLDRLEEMKFDIVFLDHMMPELDGIETLRIHRQNQCSINKDTPIIVLTANVDSGAREEYIKEGLAGYLAKPVVIDKLIGIIRENCC